MGHTPHFDGFVIRCREAGILLIDTGISKAYGGEQSALVIDFELLPLETKGEKGEKGGRKKWKETETLTALYRVGCLKCSLVMRTSCGFNPPLSPLDILWPRCIPACNSTLFSFLLSY